MPKSAKGGFYAVKRGRRMGVFLTWDECEAQTKGFPGAIYKKFSNAAEAESFATDSVRDDSSVDETEETSSNVAKSVRETLDGKKGKKRVLSPNLEDESGWDIVYSDGACKGNGKTSSVAGIGVWWGKNDPRNIAERCPGDQTNNRAELIAIVRILETVPNGQRPLLIKSDSQYSINCFRLWLPNWIRNDFKTTSGMPVKNVGIIRYLATHLNARAQNGQKVRLQYVKGHSGEEGNEGADAQANLGASLPAIPDRDWGKLEKELAERLEGDSGRKSEKTVLVPPEVVGREDESPSRGVTISPRKVRRVERPTTELHDSEEERKPRISSPQRAVSPVSTCVASLAVVRSQQTKSPSPRRHGTGLFADTVHPESSTEVPTTPVNHLTATSKSPPALPVLSPKTADAPEIIPAAVSSHDLALYMDCLVDDNDLLGDLDD